MIYPKTLRRNQENIRDFVDVLSFVKGENRGAAILFMNKTGCVRDNPKPD
jgi:hypothetical protein